MPSADHPATSLAPSKPFSISLSSSKSKQPATVLRKRPYSALAEPDSDHEESSGPQIVTGFDQSAGGAISIGNGKDQVKAPLIIKAEKNRDWREESRRKRGKNLLPAEVQAARNGSNGALIGQANAAAATDRDEVSKEAGIRFVQKDPDGDTPMPNAQPPKLPGPEPTKNMPVADDEAMAALLGVEKKSTLVIPALDSEDSPQSNGADALDDYFNEDDRFKADVASRPESASLDAYTTMPVEEFGAAMLRGMGWKEGDAVGNRKSEPGKARNVERRPALLGIGAKETPGGLGDELGAWGKMGKGKRKTDLTYNPVLLKNSKTGEMLTEEELEAKKAEQKKEGEADWMQRRDKNLAMDGRRKVERKEKDRLLLEDGSRGSSRRDRSRERDGSGGEKSRHGSSRRERSRSRERSKHGSSRRERSRPVERSRHGSSRRESRSAERKHRRRDYNDYDDYDKKDRGQSRR